VSAASEPRSASPVMGERLLTIAELAGYLNVPIGTLYQWRHKGFGPVGMRVGGHVRYRRRDVEKWLEGLSGAQPPLLSPRRRR
jgi:excisionase family DNA binding protein